MEFFIHSSTGSHSKDLLRIESKYGVAGIGYVWKILELMILSNKPLTKERLLEIKYDRLSKGEAKAIVRESGLFHIELNEYVTLKKGVDYGIAQKSLDIYFELLPLNTPACMCAAAGTGTAECASAGTAAGTAEGAPMGTAAGPCELEEEKSREEEEARQLLADFMEERCPHLLEFDEPFTLEQFRELRKNFSAEQIETVLLDMENEKNLALNKRSCFQTASNWLNRRYPKTNNS